MKQKNDFEKWAETQIRCCTSCSSAYKASRENTAKKILEILEIYNPIGDYFDFNEYERTSMVEKAVKKEFLGEGND